MYNRIDKKMAVCHHDRKIDKGKYTSLDHVWSLTTTNKNIYEVPK